MSNYITHEFFKAHRDLSDNQVTILDKAFDQINRNLNIIEDFFELDGQKRSRDGNCLIKRFTGENRLEIRTKDELPGAFARVVPVVSLNTNRVTFYEQYLNACYNSWAKASDGTGDGDKVCPVSELAGTLVHEAAHTCLGNEKYGYLISYWYRYQFRLRNGYTCRLCSASAAPSSWLPQDYKNKEGVQDETPYLGIHGEEIATPPGLPPGMKLKKYYLAWFTQSPVPAGAVMPPGIQLLDAHTEC
ncbi:MAG: hypothetical protein GVY18_13120 [Bacteroidetes bacterium]|jgi:hypothetical protein|nr:hypothetical protein [Bacteroidota bacterium]